MKAGFRCQRCGAPIELAYNTHHIKAVKKFPLLALNPANHRALCLRCHRQVENQVLDTRTGCDVHGNPIGPDHPWNRRPRP